MSRYFPQPVVRGQCNNVPILSFGFTDIPAESPDLVDDVPLQLDNLAPRKKIRLKSSRGICANHLGAAIGRLPRTPANDYFPLQPVHLIDGNAETCWCSAPYPQPDAEPVWIRIDLAVERPISKLVLKKRPPGAPRNQPGSAQLDPGAVEVGRAMAAELTIKLSGDAHHWTTVFDGPVSDHSTRERLEFDFPAQPAKQIWIIGRKFPRIENWDHSFSIANVEILDPHGTNLARVDRGAGVTVSSTMHGFGTERDAYSWYWAMNYDLGLKWVRLGFHDDVINWHWVEQRRGELRVDPVADEAITDLVKNGVNVVFSLGFGNRLYTQSDPARRLPQLWEWYWENPAPPTTPEALEAWCRYVRFMVDHFKGRAKIFEIWNEWNTPGYWGTDPNPDDYIRLAQLTIPILRQHAPGAKIMLGSLAGFTYNIRTWTPEQWTEQQANHPFLKVIGALARDVDIIAWHPFYQSNPEDREVLHYPDDVRALQRFCASCGFRGSYMVTEWAWGASYPPPAPPNWWGNFTCSELEKAKYIARLTVTHAGLDLPSFYCGFGDSYYPLDLSFLRRGFVTDPLTRMQPQPMYYVYRNLATALEGVVPADIEVQINAPAANIETVTMKRGQRIVVALWTTGRAIDQCSGIPAEIVVTGNFTHAAAFDPLNGVYQDLAVCTEGYATRVSGFLITDYPRLIILAPK